jgi:hypothetical protein
MKIEICEQMVQSWLQNYKQCEIVQTNWKVSPLRLRSISDADIAELEKFMKDFQEELNQALEDETKAALQESVDEELFDEAETAREKKRKTTKLKKLNIFKKNKARQFIRQCEVDVVGCKLDDGITDRIYLVDTAFHKTGLGYHDAVATVMKKIVRALVVAVMIFGESVPVTVAFVSPKCGATLQPQIEKVVDGLRKLLKAHSRYGKIEIELYFNERFTTDIYLPLINEIDELNDDNDLFMRAINLASLAEEHRVSTVSKPTVASATAAATKAASRALGTANDNESVVFDILNNMLSRNLIDDKMLVNLTDKDFSLRTFGISTYPILVKKADFEATGFSTKKFYAPKKTIIINGDAYRVCSQWIPERIAKLKDWYAHL